MGELPSTARVRPLAEHCIDKWKLIAFGFSFSICYGTSVGLGRHEDAVKREWQRSLKQFEYAFSVLYVCLPGLGADDIRANGTRTRL